MKKYTSAIYRVTCVKEGEFPEVYNTVNSPGDINRIAREVLKINESPVEEVHIIAINNKNKLIGSLMASKGSIYSSMIDQRHIFQFLCAVNAASFIVIHNHPSGDTTPSKQDIEITKTLVACGKMMGIHMLDHVIIGDDYASMAQKYPEIFDGGDKPC